MAVSESTGLGIGGLMLVAGLATSCKQADFHVNMNIFKPMRELEADRIKEIRLNSDLTDQERHDQVAKAKSDYAFASCGY